ncbi:MAG: aminotransferase class III-fold pyridoxal phosphate-dependent enzyme, partial [Candidatus Thermoplasmatota archaeon]|nr:aminotransferase class III-fold pyridoxal phosphate-dependent enzyme [Candidatus Thermoplasmatota archaeon]
LGALAATHAPRYRAPFQARLGETRFAPYGEVQALTERLDEQVAAVLIEPVQGEGGARRPPQGFLAEVVERAHEVGALVVVDEVQTGLGRCGEPLAIHGEGVQPDLVCLAKSLAAGLPLGATVAHERLEGLARGLHGTTFGGNPVACQAALAVLDVLDAEGLADRARTHGEQLVQGLEALGHDLLRDVRGQGLLVAADLGVRATPVLQALQARGVLALPAGQGTLRFLPPLVIQEDEVARLIQETGAALDQVAQRYARGVSA